MRFTSILLAITSAANAAKHHLLVASVNTNVITILEFDDLSGSLSRLGQKRSIEPHPSLAIDHSKKFVHAASPKDLSVSVYQIGSDYGLEDVGSVSLNGSTCNLDSAPDVSLTSGDHEPYYIYASFAANSEGCSLIFYFHPNGTLPADKSAESSLHLDQAVFSPNGTRFYALSTLQSAMQTYDVRDHGVVWMDYDESWFPRDQGNVKELAVRDNHFFGVVEQTNDLVHVDMEPTLVPQHDYQGSDIISWTKHHALPDAVNATLFRTPSLAMSPNQKYLWVASTSSSEKTAGYLTLFQLDSASAVKKLASQKLNSTGGKDARVEVTASPFGDDYVAVSSFPAGQVEIWKIEKNGEDANLRFVKAWKADKGGCGSLVWVD